MANVAAQNADYEEEHMKRLGQNCRILAQGMQLSPMFEGQLSDTQIDTIEIAAPLCDIGNIGIPKEILQKRKTDAGRNGGNRKTSGCRGKSLG